MLISKRLAVWLLVLFMACQILAAAGGTVAGAVFSRGPAGPAGPQGNVGEPGSDMETTTTCYFTGQTDRDSGEPICVYGRVAR